MLPQQSAPIATLSAASPSTDRNGPIGAGTASCVTLAPGAVTLVCGEAPLSGVDASDALPHSAHAVTNTISASQRVQVRRCLVLVNWSIR
jgi:hypothetical protein